MRRSRKALHSRRQRPVLSDTLPFEVPVSFGNRHFFEVLTEFGVRIEGSKLIWQALDDRFDEAAYVLSGIDRTVAVQTEQRVEFGGMHAFRSLEIKPHDCVKTPFQFHICHKASDSRTLSVPHPFSQVLVANFFNDHADSIIYATSLSPFSIRRPISVARHSNFRDRMHERLLAAQEGIEESGKEYDQVGSFFVYKAFNNVFKFFESYRYHRAEKRFDSMIQVDISKCFDSIYTHSLPWALNGKQAIKDNLKNSKTTFGAKFDALMQSTNQAETNGIIIGPEFSRVFAEMILQDVDVRTEKRLREGSGLHHRRDYEIFRYVDDYFVFFNGTVDSGLIVDTLSHNLESMKLHLNKAKTKVYDKPVITEITIAKSAISLLIESEIVSSREETIPDPRQLEPSYSFSVKCNSRNLIIGYKTILKTASVSYSEVGNFTFALLEASIDRMLSDFIRSDQLLRSDHRLTVAIQNVLEFAFFTYAAAPRVNLSIRLTRMISVIARAIRKLKLSEELRHHIFKYAHDNIVHQLRKNQASEFREIESLYLLTSLGELGREYWLDEESLCDHLRITKNTQGDYVRDRPLNHLMLTVTLQYIKTRKKYSKLRAFLISQIVSLISERSSYVKKDAEVLMLFLDAISCPYIDDNTKALLSSHFAVSPANFGKLRSVSDNWFTTWTGFNLAKELDAKRYREVY